MLGLDQSISRDFNRKWQNYIRLPQIVIQREIVILLTACNTLCDPEPAINTNTEPADLSIKVHIVKLYHYVLFWNVN